MSTKNLRFLTVTLVALFAFASVSAHAEYRKHPRRAEVNKRLNNQQNRVNDGLEDGQLSNKQAKHIENQDARIRRQERRDAARDGGHITKAEQRRLNREENHVSGEINRDERGNSQTAAPVAPPATSQ